MAENVPEDVPIRTLYVSPIRSHMMDDIEGYFERFGKVEEVRFNETNSGFQYCFVQFASTESAKEAVKNKKHRIGDVIVKVKAADSHHQPDSKDYVDYIIRELIKESDFYDYDYDSDRS